jgi:branched-chain amino acid transport system permease protein
MSANLRRRPSLPAAPFAAISDRIAKFWSAQPAFIKLLAVLVLFFALAILLPSGAVASVMAPQSSWALVLFYPVGCYVLLALGLNVVVGEAGMLDLGYVAFFAVGGYVMALLATKQHWSFWVILPIGVVLAAGSGLILGAPTLRLRGDYLAIVTLGFGQIIDQAINNVGWTGGPQGVSNIPHPPTIGHLSIFTYQIGHDRPYYYLILAAIFLVVFLISRLKNSRIGRGWAAIREDEDAAELMGVPTYRFRLWAFAIGASVGGFTGVFFASQQIFINPGQFTYSISVLILVCVVLGGSGNMAGVILGAFVVAWLPERLRFVDRYRVLGTGVLLVVLMIFRPEGLLPSRRKKAEMSAHDAGGGGMTAPIVPPSLEVEA